MILSIHKQKIYQAYEATDAFKNKERTSKVLNDIKNLISRDS